jgi:hypothetical protein
VGLTVILKDFKLNQNFTNLIQAKTNLSKLQNFGIKYGFEGFEIRNNFPYRNFSIFKTEFELQFRKASRC